MLEQIQTEDQPIVFANQQAFEDAVLKIIQERLVIDIDQQNLMYDRGTTYIFNLKIKSDKQSESFSQTDLYLRD